MQKNGQTNRYFVRNMHLVPPTVVPPNHGIFRKPPNDDVAYLKRNPSAHAAKRAENNYPTLKRAPGAYSVNNYPTLKRAASAHPVNNYPRLKRAISAHAAKRAANNRIDSVEEEPELDCVVCEDKKPNCILYPCKHFCMCIECAKQVQREFNKCPICRTPIKEIVDTSLWTAEKLKNTTKFTALPYIVNLYS